MANYAIIRGKSIRLNINYLLLDIKTPNKFHILAHWQVEIPWVNTGHEKNEGMNNSHLASIMNSEKICFDYMDFLSASYKKHWRFVDTIYGVMPIFSMVLKSRVTTSQTRNEHLKELALQQVVSTQVRDEANIVRLIELAVQQGLVVFDI